MTTSKATRDQDERAGAVHVATGPFGLVGRPLLQAIPSLVPLDVLAAPADLVSPHSPEVQVGTVDITDAAAVARAFRTIADVARGRPIVVFHLAALTDTKSNDETIFDRVNVQGTVNVLHCAVEAGARFIHISTDYVFGGGSLEGAPYTEDDRPTNAPPGAYASSKFRAENAVLDHPVREGIAVARIAFPYGGLGNRPGLAEKMAQRFEDCRAKQQAARLFDDQLICPSYVPDIVRGLKALAGALLSGGRELPRVYHLVGAKTTPYQFGSWVQRSHRFGDVKLEASSVAGTPYAQNLWLSSERTEAALGLQPTPHEAALAELAARRPGR